MSPSRSHTALRIEGGLFPSDLAARLAGIGSTRFEGVDPKSYGKQDQAERNEAIQLAWTQASSAWRRFQVAIATLAENDPGTTVTRERLLLPLFEALGYGRLPSAAARTIDDRVYPISHQWMTVPIHLLGCGVDLDHRRKGVRGAANTSPHGLVQDYLNRRDDALWALLSNGLTLRLLRDHQSLTRQAYVEFDIETILAGDDYAAFASLWLLCHSSRAAFAKPDQTWWERWHQQGREVGVRALDQLSEGVQRAIEHLGSGFLAHPNNRALRDELTSGELSVDAYYRLLLRLVYRLLFLFVAEDRGVLLSATTNLEGARVLYTEHYSTQRLRRLAERVRGTHHADLFCVLRLVMDKLGSEGAPALALPSLGADFWGPPALGPLAIAELRNVDFLDAIRALAFTRQEGALHRIDYRNLGAAEFGSVYESLLELKPHQARAEVFELKAAAGNERKTTGSYYTPDSLVQCLLDSAVDPVLARARAEPDPERALLDLKVCDPACGSGHFLVAAAHRIAKALAQVRSGDDEPSPVVVRQALREVVAHCLYGVDLKPMAVELCKVNLWLEAQAPDLPWTFLEAHIQEGNSLLGATVDLIAKGIPDAALDPLLGDEKEFCSQLKRENKARKKKGSSLFDLEGKGALPRVPGILTSYLRAEHVADRTAAEVREKAEAYGEWAASAERRRAELVADAWCAAFVMKKTKDAPPPVTEEMFRKLRDGIGDLPPKTEAEVKRLGREYRFTHWHLKFPAVFDEVAGKRGFDLVIGNPPWERIKLQEKEWFATRSPEVANAKNKAERGRRIDALRRSDPALHAEFESGVRNATGESRFVLKSARFPLCGRGDVNTYTLFTELARSLVAPRGRVGLIVPSGIATDDTTKSFFGDLIERGSLVSLFSFFEVRRFFLDTDDRKPFCILTLAGSADPETLPRFAFDIHAVGELAAADRSFRLQGPDFALLNPNTRTCPVFASNEDAELTKGIYRRVAVLWDENRANGNPWGLSFARMFDMSEDSGIFRERATLDAEGWTLRGNRFVKGDQTMLPLYEAKMVHHFDHRFGDYRFLPKGSKSTRLPKVPIASLEDPMYEPVPRYWVPRGEVEDRLQRNGREGNVAWSWPYQWLLGWRDTARNDDERSVIAGVIPRVGVGDKFLLMLPERVDLMHCLSAMLSSFVFDYVARQKLGGTNLKYFTMRQIAAVPPTVFSQHVPWVRETLSDWIKTRVAELLSTSNSLTTVAELLLGHPRVFPFNPARRFLLRCELDAAFFHLYGLARSDVDYVMDTFPIVRKHDRKEHGEYRTKRVILEIYDAMQQAIDTGKPYETRLNPPPADLSLTHKEKR